MMPGHEDREDRLFLILRDDPSSAAMMPGHEDREDVTQPRSTQPNSSTPQ